MTTQHFFDMENKYGAHNYKPLPIVISEGEGIWVKDAEGNTYMDMLSAYSALNQGHRHPRIIKALKEQADQLTLTSRAFFNDQLGPFYKQLSELCEMEMVLPMNTGAEAVETAIKAARKWGYQNKGVLDENAEIIVCENNFHGRTITIISFSTEDQYKDGFSPFTPGFAVVPYGNSEALEDAFNENTVAFLVEPIQGEGGVIVPPKGYLTKARELCDQYNALLIADEIQTGLCRTGKLFAYQYEPIKPDMLILGKALGGGVFPVSAVVSSEDILGVFNPGDHGSTFGGNPLGCAVARASLDVLIEENLADRAAELGEYFIRELREIDYPYIKEVRGYGLLIGVELTDEAGGARRYCEALKKEGLLCKETHDNVIRFAPPLIIKKEEVDWALERVRRVLVEEMAEVAQY